MGSTTIEPGRRERIGAWIYTGSPGRLASFSVDLGLSLAALGIYGARRTWERLSSIPRP
jgi:hypothetical protein